jgi:hypothetical protein
MIINLTAQQFFEAIIKIKETNLNGNIIYNEEKKILFNNNKIKENIKYKNILKLILNKVYISEQKYIGEDLFLIETVNDLDDNVWTVTITVTDKDVSISHFISKQKNKNINGWINRDNKDIFTFRLFNF